jgi:hypothetical protein
MSCAGGSATLVTPSSPTVSHLHTQRQRPASIGKSQPLTPAPTPTARAGNLFASTGPRTHPPRRREKVPAGVCGRNGGAAHPPAPHHRAADTQQQSLPASAEQSYSMRGTVSRGYDMARRKHLCKSCDGGNNICEEIARCDTLLSPIGRPTSRAHSSIFVPSPSLSLSSLSPPPMLGPRTRSAAQRVPRAEQPEVQHNDNGNDDEREPKRTKRGERSHAPASEQPEAAEAAAEAAATLYDFYDAQLLICVFSSRSFDNSKL